MPITIWTAFISVNLFRINVYFWIPITWLYRRSLSSIIRLLIHRQISFVGVMSVSFRISPLSSLYDFGIAWKERKILISICDFSPVNHETFWNVSHRNPCFMVYTRVFHYQTGLICSSSVTLPQRAKYAQNFYYPKGLSVHTNVTLAKRA